MTEPTETPDPTEPGDDHIPPNQGPNAPDPRPKPPPTGDPRFRDPRTTGHERFAGDPIDDGFGDAGGDRANAPDNQTPEVTEFGSRAVESGDPEGEHRPNGDPHVIGQPAGGGDRDPQAPQAPQAPEAPEGRRGQRG